MTDSKGQVSKGSGNDLGSAPDAKRQRLDDASSHEVAPDPTKITIKIKGHAESFVFDRHTAINHSLFIEAAMTGRCISKNV